MIPVQSNLLGGKMSEQSESNSPTAANDPRQVAFVGLNRETTTLLPNLMDVGGLQVIKILNPDLEDLSRLTQYPHLSIIIDTTHNPTIAARLRKLPLKKVDVISGLGARLLFCGVGKSSTAEKEVVLRRMEDIREAVCLTKNKEEILKVILNTAMRTAGADCGSLMLLDPSKRHFTIEASSGLSENVVVTVIQRAGKGIAGTALRRGEPILLQGAVDRKTFCVEYQKPEITSSICCPILYGDEPIGVFNIASKNPDRIFGEEDVAFLNDLAALTAEVIKTSKEMELNQHSNFNLGLMNSVREILAMKYRFEERMNLLLMKIANALGAKECTYYEFDTIARSFIAKCSSSIGLSLQKDRPLILDDFFAHRVIKTGSTFCVNATGKSPRSKKWYILQPLRSSGSADPVGTLFIFLQSEKNHLKVETALLRKIGELLSREISKNRDMETIKSQSLKYSAISQFSFDIANAKSLPGLSKMILSNIGLILEAETCVLRLRNLVEENLEVCEVLAPGKSASMAGILELDAALAADRTPGKGVLRIEDLSQSEYARESLGGLSVLTVGIEISGEILGTLSLYNKQPLDHSVGRIFSESDREVLLNFALQVSKGLMRFFPFPALSTKESIAVV